MNTIELCYKLQGLMEIDPYTGPSEDKLILIYNDCSQATSSNVPQADHFCLWLLGWFEYAQPNKVTETQWAVIKDHLQLVFDKVTPNRGNPINVDPPAGPIWWQTPPDFTPPSQTIPCDSLPNTSLLC